MQGYGHVILLLLKGRMMTASMAMIPMILVHGSSRSRQSAAEGAFKGG